MIAILLLPLILIWWAGALFSHGYCAAVSPGIWDVSGLSLRWRLWCAFGLLALWPLYLAAALQLPLEDRG